jgi:prolycopene isomerase
MVHSIFVNPAFDSVANFKLFTEGNPEKSMFGMVNYTMKDPTNAPKGKNAISVMSMLPYNYMDNWQIAKGYDAYKALKEKVAKIYIKRAEKYLPNLTKYIEVMEIGTPRTMERYTLCPKGSIFGWEYNKDQSMLKRLPQKTPIKNLFLAGAWTFPGGGQSAVLISGNMAADIILGEE